MMNLVDTFAGYVARNSREMSKFYYEMARDCLERARLGMHRQNQDWFIDEVLMAARFRDKARHWRKQEKR